MNSRRKLFIATAAIEAGAGLALLCVPSPALGLLLSAREPSPEALMAARLCAAALLAIGVACWLARDDGGSRSQYALLWGMLIYNAGASVLLAMAGALMCMSGVALWPAVALHAAMAVWCATSLRAWRVRV